MAFVVEICKADDKSNEITEILLLLVFLDIEGENALIGKQIFAGLCNFDEFAVGSQKKYYLCTLKIKGIFVFKILTT